MNGPAASPGWTRWVVAVVVLGLTVWGFAGMLGHEFHSDDFSLVLGNRDLGIGGFLRWLVLGDYGGRPWVYWRPGWSLLFYAMHGAFGASPAPYMAAALLLHLVCVLVVYRIALAVAGAALPAGAAAAWFALHPAHAEAVIWVSAAFNVVPACLLLTAAGWLVWRHRQHGRTRDLAVAVVCIAASFAWKEAAYAFPLVIVAAFVAEGPRWPRRRRDVEAAVAVLAVAALIVMHYAWRNQAKGASATLGEHAAVVIACAAGFLRHLAPLPGSDGVVVAIAATLAAIVWLVGTRLARYLLAWSACAMLPYVLMSSGGRFAYFFHVPLSLLLAHGIGHAFGCTRSPARSALAALAIAAMSWVTPLQLRAEVEKFGRESAAAERAIASLAAEGLAAGEKVVVDRIPEFLRNGIEDALELRTGNRVVVRSLEALPRPPFVIFVDHEAYGGRDAVVRHFDEAAGRFVRRTCRDLFGELVPVPLFTLAGRSRVVEDLAAATRLLVDGVVDPGSEVVLHAPLPPIAGEPVHEPVAARIVQVRTDIRDMGLVVECERAVVLAVAFPLPADFTKAPGAIHVDGRPVPVVRANVLFHAIVVPAGRHDVRLVPSFGP